jgi:hypothetical protein
MALPTLAQTRLPNNSVHDISAFFILRFLSTQGNPICLVGGEACER